MKHNKVASTSTSLCCFKFGESGYRVVECTKGDRYGKGLFIESGEYMDEDALVDFK